MHAPIQLTYEEYELVKYALALLQQMDNGNVEAALIAQTLDRFVHHCTDKEIGLGAMPGIRHAKDDLYYIDDRTVLDALVSAIKRCQNERWIHSYHLLLGVNNAMTSPNLDEQNRTLIDPFRLAILAAAFLHYNNTAQQEPAP